MCGEKVDLNLLRDIDDATRSYQLPDRYTVVYSRKEKHLDDEEYIYITLKKL